MENRRDYERKKFEMRYSEIKNYERLSIPKAKELYNEAMENTDLEIRRKMLDKVVLGTLYMVYKHIEKYMFELFESPVYDIDDLINAYTEYWIKGIYDGVLNTKNVSNYLNNYFQSKILNSLNGLNSENNLEIKSVSRILDKIIPAYIELEKNLKRKPDIEELADYCNISIFKVEPYYNNIEKFYNEYYESLINDDDCFDYLLSNNSKKINMQVLLDSFSNAELSDNYYSPKSMEEIIINKKYLIDFREKLIKNLNDRYGKYEGQKRNAEIFLKFFGLYDENRYSFDDLSKEYHIDKERIRKIIMNNIMYIRARFNDFGVYLPELPLSIYIKKDIKTNNTKNNNNSYNISIDSKDITTNKDNDKDIEKPRNKRRKRNLTNNKKLSKTIDENHSIPIVKSSVEEAKQEVEVSEDVLRVREIIKKLKNDDPTTTEYEELARSAIEENPLYIRFVSINTKCYEELVNICKEKKKDIIIKSYSNTKVSNNNDLPTIKEKAKGDIVKELIEKLKNDDPTTNEYEILARNAIEKNRLYIRFVSTNAGCYEELVDICNKKKALSYKYNNK